MTDAYSALPSAAELGLARLVHEPEVESTMDRAHALAADGADAGTLVLADRQLRGRGRGGQTWVSNEPTGVWMTLIERPDDARDVGVLALRLGLALASALAPSVDARVGLKWPNDVLADGRKLAGILVEARWRQSAVEWIAIGIGINLKISPMFPQSAAVRSSVTRNEVLRAVLPGVRLACQARGELTSTELAAWSTRDVAIGRTIREPLSGIARGISAAGALLVEPPAGAPLVAVRSGSLRFVDIPDGSGFR